ncbi:MAG: multidrug MFS transporter [SAR202 cluster bacterium Casp-Chloro-G4]|nr:epoxide hydrolase [Chloroflexota bacterium]MDA1227177.1 epoxide hydrolase [Chloroflexota bacterium]PKB61765.1 MAG: multidrug MFS transporter [SAR202 cluster bacterium Casp-Chloro-G4]
MSVEPFQIAIPDDVLEDLRRRIAGTRWPDEIPGTGWDYGSNMAYIRELADYWLNQYDWRKHEAFLNGFSQFRADVNGIGVHFIQEKGKGPNPMPLLITHGWPSTFWEMHKIIPMLSDPASYGGDAADAFDVVVPSMPSFGFSDRTTERGWSFQRVSDLWAMLMTDILEYKRFGAQGGDWGAGVTAGLGHRHPDKMIGLHVAGVSAMPDLGPGSTQLTQAEGDFLGARARWREEEGAYGHIQGTKPQTLSYGLTDSPVGLAAWIIEKFRSWSDCNGDLESVYTKDELLTNITIYWVTQTISSSVRIYYESQRDPLVLRPGEKIEVPTAVASFPKDISRPPREWGERVFDLRQWTDMPDGGHFAALERPERLVEDIRSHFRALR